MAAAQHKLSRRALLAGACAALPLARHSGLDPESMNTAAPPVPAAAFMDPGFRRDDGKWRKALARYAQAEAGLEAVAHCEDERVYDRAVGRHIGALRRLLRSPAPDVAAAVRKLELIVRHSAWEMSYGEAAFAVLQRDIGRFSAASVLPG
jgi:hypothetical protein